MKDLRKSPPAPDKRRYDSLAVLFQGDSVCGASCFDGENLLLANNSGIETALCTKIIDYLKSIAAMARDRIDLKNTLKGPLMSYAHANIVLMKSNVKYQARFQAALDKLTYSIKCAYLNPGDPSSFSLELTDAIRNGKIIFLTNTSTSAKKRLLHAEMQIVDYLYFNQRKPLNSPGNLYIGISKKCCLNCELAIHSVNSAKKRNIVEVRGEGHGFSFSAGIPVFLKSDTKIREEFLRLRGIQNLEEVFFTNQKGRISGDDQLHTPSSSVYDSNSTHDEFSEISISIEDEKKPKKVLTQPTIINHQPHIKTTEKAKNDSSKKNVPNKKKSKALPSTANSPLIFFPRTRNSTKKTSSSKKTPSATSPISKKQH
jgi:hypothetical protein